MLTIFSASLRGDSARLEVEVGLILEIYVLVGGIEPPTHLTKICLLVKMDSYFPLHRDDNIFFF